MGSSQFPPISPIPHISPVIRRRSTGDSTAITAAVIHGFGAEKQIDLFIHVQNTLQFNIDITSQVIWSEKRRTFNEEGWIVEQERRCGDDDLGVDTYVRTYVDADGWMDR